jgi:hypothetical protein
MTENALKSGAFFMENALQNGNLESLTFETVSSKGFYDLYGNRDSVTFWVVSLFIRFRANRGASRGPTAAAPSPPIYTTLPKRYRPEIVFYKE